MHMNRCLWVNMNNPKYIKYHDEEWCEEKHDDHDLFELFIFGLAPYFKSILIISKLPFITAI